MIKQLVDILYNIALRHKGVYTFRYEDKPLHNAQNNHKGIQFYVDDVSYHQLNVTTNIFKVEFEIYILGHPTEESGNTIIDIQDKAYTVAVNVMGYIDNHPEFYNVMSVYDFSIMTLSHYSDDDSAGVKLSLILQCPSPLNLCTLDENFDDEPHQEPQEGEIDIPDNSVGDIDITTIKLPYTPRC